MLLTFSLLFRVRGFFKFVLCFFADAGFADFSACEPRLDILDRAPKDLLGIRVVRKQILYAIIFFYLHIASL